jgi:TonB-dependent SusC/RagA subfamily outer membrane receptor
MKHFSLMLVMVLFSMSTALAQRTVTGTVLLDSEGEAIGANVVIDGDEGIGTVTEFDGTFSLSVPETAKALKISYTGFVTQIVSVEGLTEVSVTLSRDNILEEVIVVGYQTLKKSDVIEGISVVSGDDIQQIPVGNVENLLQGKSTGLQVTGANGKPGASGYMRSRGTGSANSSNEPLYVVNGAQVSATFMNAINPNDIESINVLKDAAATSIYGSSGSNGVIVIITKRGSSKPNARPEITFSAQSGIKQMVEDNYDMMNAQQKIDYETELYNDFGVGNGTTVASYEDPAVVDSLLAI